MKRADICTSNIEANLVVVCVSLPALRQFVKHFAPRLMRDDSQPRSTGPSYLKNSDNTFDTAPSSRGKKKYGRMHDESALEMTGNFGGKEAAQDNTQDIADDNSEKAIWQTRTAIPMHD